MQTLTVSAGARAVAATLALFVVACGGSTAPRTSQTGPTTPQGPSATPPDIAPIANAGADQTLECSSHSGSPVTLSSAGSRDTDGVITKYEWFENGFLIATGATPTVTLPLGANPIILRVTDDKGGTNDDEVIVTVQDTRPPLVQWTVSPTTLWPPNHAMRLVSKNATAVDVCDPAPTLGATITSNEAANGLGDGDTSPDWNVQSLSNGTLDLWVRAERSGLGTGRVYALDAVATDHSGNSSSASGRVTVPHDQR